MPRPTERQVVDWLRLLGHMVAPATGSVDDKLVALVPPLLNRYSSEEFDSASREHVARHCKFFPSYAELCEHLDTLPSRAPIRPALPSHIDDMDDMDRAWVKFWYVRCDEIMAEPSGSKRDATVANLKSLIQSQSWKAWRVICPESIVIHDRPTDAQVVALARLLRMPGGPLAGRPMPGDDKPAVKPSPVSEQALRAMREARGITPIGSPA